MLLESKRGWPHTVEYLLVVGGITVPSFGYGQCQMYIGRKRDPVVFQYDNMDNQSIKK